MLPRYPIHLPHSNRAFEVPLQKLSPEAIETFLKINASTAPAVALGRDRRDVRAEASGRRADAAAEPGR
jgi:Ferritin-like